ncbi:RNA polymerase sigma factor [Streptomyces sp. NPDC020807]|uniref:RNA polymerase sigma factor n=1 Tax=Streptomyces sp. NPDC020807 TaxID=3155119 RepID=UPI00340389A8
MRESFDVLFADWYPRVLGWARYRCVDPHDAEDVTQQVFVDAWLHSRGHCPRRGGLGPWLRGITAHKAADASGALVRRHEAVRRLTQGPVPASPDTATRAVERLVTAARMADLPARRREVLFLAYYLGFTQPEIARRLGLPLGTVKSHTRRALRALAVVATEPTGPPARRRERRPGRTSPE